MSSSIKIRVKVGIGEVEIESPADSLEKAIDSIPLLLDRVSSVIASIPNAGMSMNIQDNAPLQVSESNEIPEVRIEKGDSLSDIITKLFKTPWGRSARRLGDVKKVLEYYGLAYPKQSIAVTLLRLAQHNKLRRFKGDDNEFVYTASTELLTELSSDNSNREAIGAL